MVTKPQNDGKSREKARREFYRIVNERLRARLERRETYTTTRDLYAGYEKLHREGFGDTPPSQTVAQVLGQKAFRDRLYYARHIVTHKAERSGPGRTSPYKLYLRDDATPPKDYVLIPITTPKDRIPQVIAEAKGARDATLHVAALADRGHVRAGETQFAQSTEQKYSEEHKAPAADYEGLVRSLTDVIATQAALIERLTAALRR